MKIGSNPADSICIVRFVGCQAPMCILISGQGCARIVREKCTNLKKEVIDMKTCTIEMNSQKHPACKAMVSGIATCPECGRPMCPVCHRHNVTQLSRVTGYVQDVAGWNAAKKQELIDRRRYDLNGR